MRAATRFLAVVFPVRPARLSGGGVSHARQSSGAGGRNGMVARVKTVAFMGMEVIDVDV